MVPWANGLGTTAVVARVPDTDDWAWRLSIADVVSDGPFSSLPGVERWIAVVSGAGMVLTVDGADHHVTPVSGSFAFDGGAATTCRLVDGPVEDLNLMVRRGRARGSLEVVADGVAIRLDGLAACVVLEGSAIIEGESVGPHDAVLAPTGTAMPGPDARIALVRITPV